MWCGGTEFVFGKDGQIDIIVEPIGEDQQIGEQECSDGGALVMVNPNTGSLGIIMAMLAYILQQLARSLHEVEFRA